jgi:hypothetical protein
MRWWLPLLALVLASCVTTEDEEPPAIDQAVWDDALLVPHDAGDEAWAKAIVPILWGRGPTGMNEVRVLVDLIEQSSRADVVRAMATSPEYIDHWQDLLLDDLLIDRLSHDSKPECYEEALGLEGPALAAWVRDHAPEEEGFDTPWTMADLVRSTLALDDLSPLYRANLFARLGQQFFDPVAFDALSYRQDKVEVFLSSYLDRRVACMECHNSEFSVTGHTDPTLDRTWEIPGYVEAALFGASDGPEEPDDLQILFRRMGVEKGILEADFGLVPDDELFDGCSVRDGEPAGCENCMCISDVCNVDPSCCGNNWTQACADMCIASNAGCGVARPPGFQGCQVLPGLSGCPGCDCELAVCEIEPSCCSSAWDESCVELCREHGNVCLEPTPGFAPWGTDLRCPQFAPKDLVETDPLDQTGHFAGERGADTSIWDLEDLLHEGFERVRGVGPAVASDLSVPATEAFAWLLAVNRADQVWKTVHGQRLTLAHTFARNQIQRDQLWDMATVFVENDFSLVELLVSATTHPVFNQVAPIEVADDVVPYYMPPLVNPWTVEESAIAQRGNGSGDLSRVLPPRALLGKVAHAAGWQPFSRFPKYYEPFQQSVQRRLGVQLEVSEPGIAGSDYQSLVGWEWVFGECRTRVDELEPAEGNRDWIDGLSDVASQEGVTIGEMLSALKDRLLTDPVIEEEEQALLEDVLGASFDDPIPADIDGIRRVCGVWLATPQFRLIGVPQEDRGDVVPSLTVDGQGFEDRCEALSSAMYAGGLGCTGDRATLP